MSKTAVVILNYNGADFLDQFLPPLIKYTPNADLIVADNCSTDHSMEVLQKFASAIRILELDQNYGYAGGYNHALAQIQSDYYLLLNSDVEVSKNWLEPLTQFMETHPHYAAAQPKLKAFHDKSSFEYAGAAGGFLDKLGYPYCQGRIFDTIEKDHGQYDKLTDVFWCSGAALMIRAEVFHKMGGFDADFFAHMEEIDLCWRLRNHGYKLAMVPNSEVFHVGGGTLNKVSPNKTFLNFRNNLYMLVKNAPLGHLVCILFIRLFLDTLAALKLWKDESGKHAAAVLKAYVHGISYLRKMFKKRAKTSAKALKGTILWQYYLLSKKTFHAINNTK